MKTKFNGILTLLLALVVQISFAQEKTITGTVSDEGGPLPGVSIVVKGTVNGTQTDFDGNYTLKANAGDVIVFSYVGMTTLEKTVGSSNTINVLMAGSNVLEEVVIVGYGTTTKKSFTGSIKTVKSEDLEVKSVSNVSQALAGEVSGVQVINTSGQPGTESTIRIRGFGSVNGNRDPLYVVDGVPFSGSINSINPSDIASTTVLKDATATAIYGSRGANGVILINTKKGKSNSSYIEVDVKTGINKSYIPRYSTIKSPELYTELSWEALYNKGVATGEANPGEYAGTNLFSGAGLGPTYNLWNAEGSQLIDPATGQFRTDVTRKYDPENWEDFGFQDSNRTEANLKMGGGNDNTRYFSSFGYLEDVGYIINSDYKRYTSRINLTHKPKEWMTATVNLGYAYSEQNDNGQSSDSGSIFWFVDQLPSIFPLFLRDDAGNIVEDPIFGGNQYDYGLGRNFGALTNAVGDAHYNKSESKRHELNGNFSFNFDITENLTFENTFGAQYYSDKYNSLGSPFYGGSASQGGSIYKYNEDLIAYNILNLIRFKKSFGDHNFEVLAAHEGNSWERKRLTASMSKMVHPNIDDLNNFVIVSSPPTSYTDKASLESYFGQVNYNFEDKYFLTGSVRRDGSSRFIGDNKWDTFGSVGASWILTKEAFMEDLTYVDFLKAKVSYGLVGEQAGVGFYPGYNTFNVSNLNDGISISPRDIGNPNLTWETSKMFQTGVEFGISNFVDVALDYYIKDTENLLFDRRVGPSVGYALQTVNDGTLRNSGFEFDIAAHLIDKDDFKLDFVINGEMLNNELTTMPIDPATGEEKVLDIAGRFGRSAGHSLYDFYVKEWAGVDPADGTAMWNLYYHDANGNGSLDADEGISSLYEYTTANPDNAISQTVTKKYADATQKYVNKSIIPKVRGAFRLSATVKDFNISTQFIYSVGGYSYDAAYANLMHNREIGNSNWHTDILDRWQEPGDITNVPKLSSNYNTNVNSSSTRFIEKSDFLALNNVSLGYRVPKTFVEKMGLSSVNVSLTGDNLFLLSARDGFNPSTAESGESNQYRYSPLSTFTLGLRVKF